MLEENAKVKRKRRWHGLTVTQPELYSIWQGMRHRCYDSGRNNYKNYGGRGIRVCKSWEHDPEIFCDWALKHGYKPGLQLDRINNDGNYSPVNCRWVTPKQNARNKQNTVYLTICGITKNVSEWCEMVDISPYTVYWWVKTKGKEYAENRMVERGEIRIIDHRRKKAMFDSDYLSQANAKFKPCPFCQNGREWLKIRKVTKYNPLYRAEDKYFSIRCEACKMTFGEVEGEPVYESESDLIAAWNRRKY